jgi:hypothetical protein
MTERIEKELVLLRKHYPRLEYRDDGQWVRIPDYPLPDGWNRENTDVAFQIPIGFPGAPPYAFFVLVGIQFRGEKPANYEESISNRPPFDGSWGQFSWSTVDGQWRATASPDPAKGYTLVDWARGFANRFQEGK